MSTATTSAAKANELFLQAVEASQKAVHSGLKIQEESAQRFLEMLHGLGAPAEGLLTGQRVVAAAVTATEQTIDDAIHSLRLMNHNTQLAMGLLQKAFDTSLPSSSGADSWKTALGAMRTNTQAILQAEASVLESWAELAERINNRM